MDALFLTIFLSSSKEVLENTILNAGKIKKNLGFEHFEAKDTYVSFLKSKNYPRFHINDEKIEIVIPNTKVFEHEINMYESLVEALRTLGVEDFNNITITALDIISSLSGVKNKAKFFIGEEISNIKNLEKASLELKYVNESNDKFNLRVAFLKSIWIACTLVQDIKLSGVDNVFFEDKIIYMQQEQNKILKNKIDCENDEYVQ